MTEYARAIATNRKSPYSYASNEAMLSSQCKSLEDVRASTDASVHCDRYSTSGNTRAFSEAVQSGRNAIELSTSMVGYQDSVHPVLDGEQYVCWIQNCSNVSVWSPSRSVSVSSYAYSLSTRFACRYFSSTKV